jgi:hypothetical protein
MSLKTASILIFSFVVIVIFGYAGILIYLTWPITTTTIEKAGVFGDSFGLINALFSGAAFAGLIITILLQRKELNEARLISRKQNFEDAFYRLLDFYQRNLNAISITNHETGVNYQGVSALSYLQKKLTSAMNPYITYLQDKDSRKVYEYYLFVEIQKILVRQSRYLGTLESILLLINTGIESREERLIYWKILASQITSNELKYIFYQCLVAPKGNQLRDLVHSSNILIVRASEINLSVSLASIYEKTHGISLKRDRSTPVLPYTRGEIRKIRKQHQQKIKQESKI